MFCKHLLVYINSKVPFHEHLPPLPSHRSGVPARNSDNNNKSESWSSFIKLSEAWHTFRVQPNEQFGLFIRLSWQYTRLQFHFFHSLYDPISNEINRNLRYFRLILLYSTYIGVVSV